MVDKRSALKQEQYKILELLFKYRFGSRQLLAESLKVKPDSLYRKLKVLSKHGYIAVRFEKRLKLLGTPAAYYLTPKGFRTLQALPDHEHITDSVTKGSYKNKTVTQSFINQTLRVYTQVNQLSAIYPTLKVFTKRDMSRYSYFPQPLPDAFLSLPTGKDSPPKRFLLDVIPNSLPSKPFFQRITNYAQFFEEGGWEATGSELPILLLVGENGATERRIQRATRAAIYKAEIDEDLSVFTSTLGAIQNMEGSGAVWTSLDDPDDLLALPELE
jgi:DNA-binding PadR family transcriptional regulator